MSVALAVGVFIAIILAGLGAVAVIVRRLDSFTDGMPPPPEDDQ